MKSSQTIELMQNQAIESNKEHQYFLYINLQLQYELTEVYEALHTNITDELTEIAFDKATRILDLQLEQFHLKLKDGREELKSEWQGRLAAEYALDKVKHDLSSLFNSDVNFEGSIYENLKAFASNDSVGMTRNEMIAIYDLSIIIKKTTNELGWKRSNWTSWICPNWLKKKVNDRLELKLSSMQRSADKVRGDSVTTMNLL